MSAGEAAQTYSLLTIGDGLVSQIPALLISIASGLIVTRAATENDMGTDMLGQFGKQHQAMRVGGICVAVLGLVPGLPKVPFILVGVVLFLVANGLGV
jgi:flagellar biosynthesis protein FlhA